MASKDYFADKLYILLNFLKRQPKQLYLSFFIFLSLIAIVICIIQPWRVVQSVKVNAVLLNPKTIQKQLNIKPGTPRWRVAGQLAFIETNFLQKNHKIEDIHLGLNGNQVNVEVSERVTAGFINTKEKWYALDRKGHRVKEVTTPDGSAPIYKDFGSKGKLAQTAQSFADLDLTLRQNISQITFSPIKSNPNRLVINMNDGNTVYASIGTFGKKIIYYPGIAAQMPQKGIVDLQFGAYSYTYGQNHDKNNTKR
ncbi:cell division protein FtsQ/DivIB [Leuconostoc fallax]|uniref:Cell division protein DivIB n=1 Tax=Leuconostoc fallax TaxID=1251 RepID=A0A4R5N8H9_9LACO|nr:cell division protein FtsQ [Leuconostoc fallax]MBU7455640.1 cell division protein FtsQ [Leuconostoc fallax]TDG68111.1 hypothetical protein C5L23_000417 [Leuconostoc fallax]